MDSMQEIVQFPAIRKNGENVLSNADMLHMTDSELQQLAKMLQGVVVYRKIRATYTETEQTFCVHYGCYALGINGTDDCGRHNA